MKSNWHTQCCICGYEYNYREMENPDECPQCAGKLEPSEHDQVMADDDFFYKDGEYCLVE